MELEVILEAQLCSEVGQAAELSEGRGQAAGYRVSSVDQLWWDTALLLPPSAEGML